MHTFLENFHQGVKYSAQIESHQSQLKIEEKIVEQYIIIYICLVNWILEFGKFSKKHRKIKVCSIKVKSLWRITPNRETIKKIRNQPSIHATLIISILNIMVIDQILTSDVDWRIISSQIVRNRTLRIKKFTGTRKSLKLVRTDIWKWIRCRTTV